MFRLSVAKTIGAMQKSLIVLVSLYQYLISPLLGSNCRFYPSCSHYAQDAIQHYGCAKGCWLALCRILRCHPWHPGGYDPVNKQSENSNQAN